MTVGNVAGIILALLLCQVCNGAPTMTIVTDSMVYESGDTMEVSIGVVNDYETMTVDILSMRKSFVSAPRASTVVST